jgi:rubrerythrin
VNNWDKKRSAHRADHEAERHADREEYVTGCPLCDAEEEAAEANDRSASKATAAAERMAERDAARVRAAWLAANPDAVAWRCASCGVELTEDEADQGQGPLYACGQCGSTFSADAESNRCPDCNRYGRKLAELSCPACEDGELEPVGPGGRHGEP